MRRPPDLSARGGPPDRRPSTAGLLDNALLVVGVLVVAFVVLKVVGFIVGTILFILTVAALAAALYVGVRLYLRRR